MKYLLSIIFTFILFQTTIAQDADTLPKKDYNQHTMLKGLLVDLGTAYLPGTSYNNTPDFFNVKTGRPSTINIYMFRNIKLFGNGFFISPGLGFGLDNFFFEKDLLIAPAGDSLFSIGNGLKKSKLSANYVDIPLEFRFISSSNYKKAFKISVGAKVGVLFASKSKIKYEVGDDMVKQKLSDKSLSRFRYGLTGRIGYGHMNFFYYHGFSPLFKDKYAPEVSPYIFGLTLSTF